MKLAKRVDRLYLFELMSDPVLNYKKSILSQVLIIGLFVAIFSFNVSAVYATVYTPGTTLEPDCPPSESLSTCGLVAPLTVNGSAQGLNLARIGSSTFSTVQEMQNVFHSAGWTSGGKITDAGSATVNVAAGTGLIRSANIGTSTISYFDWDEVLGISIPNNSIRYIGLEYNAGSPQVSVRTSFNWNLKTDFPIGIVVNEGGILSIYSDIQAVGDHAANMIQREYETMPLSRDERNGGLILNETGTRNITISTGAIWDRLNRYVIPDIDTSSADTFSAYYMDGSSGFTKVNNLTQWPNTQYDDGDGDLATMTDGYYATLWFYLDTNGDVSMVYGIGEYVTAALADAEQAPMNVDLPNRLAVFGKLIGKIVYQKGASTATNISTAFPTHGGGSGSGVTNHSNLTGLDYLSSGHIGFAMSGVNSNITSLTGLTTALSASQGGTGLSSYTAGDILYASGSSTLSKLNIGTNDQVLKVAGGTLVWGTDTHLGNTNLALSGARGLALNGNPLTIDGGTGDVVFNDNGSVTIGGDLTITGDDLVMGTNSLGSLLVADGTNFNPVVLSGDATIAANGALVINYNAAQSASAINKGFLTSADWVTFNNKQAALGFTAENVANKSTDTALGSSDTLYPTQNAVKTYADNLALGLNWQNPVEIVNVIANASSPQPAVHLNAYIIDTGGNTGAWSGFNVGDLVQYQTNQWVFIKALAVGDRFGVSFTSETAGSGAMSGKDNNLVEITGGSAGNFSYTFTAPSNNDAVFVQNSNAFIFSVSFTYSTSLAQWVQLSAATNYSFTNGLSLTGNNVALGALTSDWSQTGVFNIITAGDINVDGGDLKTTNATATLFNANATTLNIGGAATSIGLGAAGATMTGGGALTINSAANTALTIDSGTTGALNIGSGNNAKTINLGTGTAGNIINIGTSNAVADTLSIGSALDALSLTSTGLNVTTLGALTGVSSINTVTHSTTAITFAGQGTLSSTGVNNITLDSGTTGGVNIGTGSNAKIITIGNTTGATALNLQSGTSNIGLQVAGTGTTGDVQIGAGGGGSATPDRLVLDIKNTLGDPAGTNGAMYYNSNTNKFRCYENGAWANCITPPGTDIQYASSYDTNEALQNITSAQTTLGMVSITPSSATGDIYITGQADVLSSNNTDQTFVLEIETGATCTGTTVATRSYAITAGNGTDRGTVIISGIVVDPGASSQSYSLCASTATGDTDVLIWRIEATVIDTGADLAEIYTTNDESLEAGDVVSLDVSLKTGVKKTDNTSGKNVLGIVSTKPGVLIGGVDSEGVKAVPIALAGRVPVKVTTENGAIVTGDYLSPSSIPGVAMKSDGVGNVIGLAMSNFDNLGVGTVMVFVKNIDLGYVGQDTVLLSDVLSIQSEVSRDPIEIISQKITDGSRFLINFVAARVTAIRGYFEEIFTEKIHAEQLCIKKSDDNEVCINGDQIDLLLQKAHIESAIIMTPVEPALENDPSPESDPERETTSTDGGTSLSDTSEEDTLPLENKSSAEDVETVEVILPAKPITSEEVSLPAQDSSESVEAGVEIIQ